MARPELRFRERTGIDGLDALFNDMLHPDPNQRPSMRQIAADDVFLSGEIGSSRARELIKASMTGDDLKLEQLTGLKGRDVSSSPPAVAPQGSAAAASKIPAGNT